MKQTIILITILTLSSSFSFGQKSKEIRYFNDDTKLAKCDVNGNPINNDSLDVKEGWLFIYTELPNGMKRIKFIKWKEGTDAELITRNKTYVVNNGATVYLLLPNDKFGSLTAVYSRLPRITPTFGALTIPIRIRQQSDIHSSTGTRDVPFDYTTDINVGLSIGARIRLNPAGSQNLSLLIGGSVTSANADSASTKGFLKSNARIGMVTSSFSIVYQIDNLNLIAAIGKDYPPGELYDKWLYTGRTWIGFGVGINLFSIRKTTDTQ